MRAVVVGYIMVLIGVFDWMVEEWNACLIGNVAAVRDNNFVTFYLYIFYFGVLNLYIFIFYNTHFIPNSYIILANKVMGSI